MSEGKREFSWVCLTGFILEILPVLVLPVALIRKAYIFTERVLPWILFISPLAGFIVSIVGLVTAKKKGKSGKGFAIAGIVVPSVVVAVAAVILIPILISSGNTASQVHNNEMYDMGSVESYVNTDYDVSQLRLPEGYDFSNITVSDDELMDYAGTKLDEITDKNYTSIRGKYQDYNFLVIKSDKLDVWLSYNSPGGFEYYKGYASATYAEPWEFAAYRPVPVDVYKDPSDKFIVITNCSDYLVISEFFGITDNYIEPTQLETMSIEFLESNEQVIYLKTNITEDMTLPEIVDVYEKLCEEEYPCNDTLRYNTGIYDDGYYDEELDKYIPGDDYYCINLERWISLDEGVFSVNVYILYEPNTTTKNIKSIHMYESQMDIDYFDYVRDSKPYEYGCTADIVRIDIKMEEL